MTFTEVIARDPADQFKAFKNTALTPNFGIGSRFFLTDWLTVNFAIRDYIIPDKFEPIIGTTRTPATSKANAESALVNNFMIYAGVGCTCPRSSPTRRLANGPDKRTCRCSYKHRFALLVALATVSLSARRAGAAQEPLADAPAIRKRFELRYTRLELGVGGGIDGQSGFLPHGHGHVRLAFHITDWLASPASATSASRRWRPATTRS